MNFTDRLALLRRPVNLAAFAACALMLGFAYYLQYARGMEPCPLCMFQRVGILVVGLLFLVAAVHNPPGWGARVYGALIVLAAATGGAISVRHLWIQSLPADQVPACGPGLTYLLNYFPLLDAIKAVLQGSGECAKVDKVFGLAIPAWTLMAFMGLGAAGLLVNGFARLPRRLGASRSAAFGRG